MTNAVRSSSCVVPHTSLCFRISFCALFLLFLSVLNSPNIYSIFYYIIFLFLQFLCCRDWRVAFVHERNFNRCYILEMEWFYFYFRCIFQRFSMKFYFQRMKFQIVILLALIMCLLLDSIECACGLRLNWYFIKI